MFVKPSAAMSSRTCLFVAVTLATCEGGVRWTRDRKFDGLVKVNGYPHSDLGGEGMNVRYCASACTSSSRCASFFYLTANRTCIMNDLIFATTGGGTALPGARYFKAVTASCPDSVGYAWIPRQQLCFKVYQTTTNFGTAYWNCSSVGDRLIVLNTWDKFYAIKTNIAYRYGASMSYYVGAVREGVINGTRTNWSNVLHPLRWLNGQLVATTGPDSGWGNSYPSNDGGVEGCMELSNGQWNDLPCNFFRAFVCERLFS